MIICSCNALSEAEVRMAAREGAATPDCAYARLGCEPQCGCCLDYAEEIIEEEQGCCATPGPAARPHLRLVA